MKKSTYIKIIFLLLASHPSLATKIFIHCDGISFQNIQDFDKSGALETLQNQLKKENFGLIFNQTLNPVSLKSLKVVYPTKEMIYYSDQAWLDKRKTLLQKNKILTEILDDFDKGKFKSKNILLHISKLNFPQKKKRFDICKNWFKTLQERFSYRKELDNIDLVLTSHFNLDKETPFSGFFYSLKTPKKYFYYLRSFYNDFATVSDKGFNYSQGHNFLAKEKKGALRIGFNHADATHPLYRFAISKFNTTIQLVSIKDKKYYPVWSDHFKNLYFRGFLKSKRPNLFKSLPKEKIDIAMIRSLALVKINYKIGIPERILKKLNLKVVGIIAEEEKGTPSKFVCSDKPITSKTKEVEIPSNTVSRYRHLVLKHFARKENIKFIPRGSTFDNYFKHIGNRPKNFPPRTNVCNPRTKELYEDTRNFELYKPIKNLSPEIFSSYLITTGALYKNKQREIQKFIKEFSSFVKYERTLTKEQRRRQIGLMPDLNISAFYKGTASVQPRINIENYKPNYNNLVRWLKTVKFFSRAREKKLDNNNGKIKKRNQKKNSKKKK